MTLVESQMSFPEGPGIDREYEPGPSLQLTNTPPSPIAFDKMLKTFDL